ncbi:unnamed protein product [Pleuronectes platessa]|uniref:Uncharacterized protein n=1 Tax=Pleuronectes platessa TaxID=8262 RepID=A0A9N7Z016_PLEPL|nr:unnamed protein product [Pleuronectes platessa]
MGKIDQQQDSVHPDAVPPLQHNELLTDGEVRKLEERLDCVCMCNKENVASNSIREEAQRGSSSRKQCECFCPAEAKKDQRGPPCVADVFHKPSSQLGHSCPNRRPWEKMRKRRESRGSWGKEEGGLRGAVGRVAGLAKVRQAEAAGSVGTVREGMCEML